MQHFGKKNVAQVALLGKLGEKGTGGAPTGVARIDSVCQIEPESQRVDDYIKGVGGYAPRLTISQSGREREKCQQEVRNVGVADGCGVETKASP